MSPANKSAAADAPAPSSDSPLNGPISAEKRWQLILGADEELGGLRGSLQAMDRALGALYNTGDDAEDGGGRRGGLGASAPSVTRWLGDIRNYFPNRGLVQDCYDTRYGTKNQLLCEAKAFHKRCGKRRCRR